MTGDTNYDDLARLEYGRILWRNPKDREQLIKHWTDVRHPYRERFLQNRVFIEWLLTSQAKDEAELERKLIQHDTSLRAMIREIPPVFGSFWRH